MRLLIIRRIAVALLGLAFALGTIGHGMQAAAMGAKMAGGQASAVMMDRDMSGPDGCNTCGDPGGKMTTAACAAVCATPLAILVAPVPALEPVAVEVSPTSSPLRVGLTFPPDLSPPRPASLS
jgi:hypothetical protein